MNLIKKSKDLWSFAKKRKKVSLVAVLLIVSAGYFTYTKFLKSPESVRYVVTQAQKGTLISSISGSGQVSSSNQVEIKPKVSGDITAVYAILGKEVKAGAILAVIDSADASRTVRDAETSLETAKLEFDKMMEPLDELTLLQSENSLIQAKESKNKVEYNLNKSYEDGFNNVSNVFLALPTVMTELRDLLYGSDKELGGESQWNVDFYVEITGKYNDEATQFKKDIYEKYQVARDAYDKNFLDYKSTSRFASQEDIEALINQTYETDKLISEVVRNSNNLIQLYQDELTQRGLTPVSLSDTHLSSLSSYTNTTNSYLLSLLSSVSSISDYKDSIVSAERTIREKELSLVNTKDGPDDLDIRAKKITVQQKEDALTDAKQALADHYVRAPFDGVIAKVSVKKGDSISSGSAVATIVTKQETAEISLNEIDVAKIEVGQKATLLFDAVPDLTITGQVAEVEAVGTVSQGVVTYMVKIAFDTQDDRVKTAMSVSASIITEVKPDVILVPNSAVKTQGENKYVEVAKNVDSAEIASAGLTGIVLSNEPVAQIVQIGSANDEFTEITSGLKEGDFVISRTIQPSTVATATTQNSSFKIPGISGGSRTLGR